MIKQIINFFIIILLFISCLALFATLRTIYIWGDIYIEQILISLQQGTTGIGKQLIYSYIYFAFIPAIISTLILIFFINKTSALFTLSVIFIIISLYKINFFNYIINKNTYTDLYEKEYVNPKNIKFKFPLKKKNMILLYLESMEKDYSNSNIIGKNLIPNLTELAKKETSFNGFIQLPTQDYTIAAMVGGFCAIPYKYSPALNYTDLFNFLSSATCYTDILKENGYKNYLIKGTDLSFAHTGLFFKNHGYDYVKGINDFEPLYGAKLENNQGTSWGYRDSIYYNIAKKQILEISQQNQPFVFTLITLDTHKPDVYVDKQCTHTDDANKDVIICADKMAINFINWLKHQDFYDNTTIVIMGDHTSTGKNSIYPNHKDRQIVNIILNSSYNKPINTNRKWTTLDIAPTILNALGIEFHKGQFGLGRSLYKEEQTLYEKYGKPLLHELLKATKMYKQFTKTVNTFKDKYNLYPAYDYKIDEINQIKKYASFSDVLFNNIWLDTLSFTLPENDKSNITFETEFRILFVEKNQRNIKVYANNTLIDTFSYDNKSVQPIKLKINIPANIINNHKLKLEFKSDNLGYQATGVGLGILNFKISKTLN